MPRFRLTPQDQQIQRLGQLNQIGSQADAADSHDMSSMMDMFSKMYGLQQEQALAPLKASALQSETEKNNAMSGAEASMGRYHDAMAGSIPSRGELNEAKAQDEEAKAFMKLYPGGLESIKDPYSAEAFFRPGSQTQSALHAAGDRMYLQHHDPLWSMVQQGQATPEMQASPYLNEGEKWVASHNNTPEPVPQTQGAERAGEALRNAPLAVGHAISSANQGYDKFMKGLTGLDVEKSVREPVRGVAKRFLWDPLARAIGQDPDAIPLPHGQTMPNPYK